MTASGRSASCSPKAARNPLDARQRIALAAGRAGAGGRGCARALLAGLKTLLGRRWIGSSEAPRPLSREVGRFRRHSAGGMLSRPRLASATPGTNGGLAPTPRRSCVGGRRLCGAHSSPVAGRQRPRFDAAIATVGQSTRPAATLLTIPLGERRGAAPRQPLMLCAAPAPSRSARERCGRRRVRVRASTRPPRATLLLYLGEDRGGSC